MTKTFKTFVDFTSSQAKDFDTIQHIAYDVNAINNFLNQSMRSTDTNEIKNLRYIVDCIIILINTNFHETENIENPKDCLGDN